MIELRNFLPSDYPQITDIYNFYVDNTVITFDTVKSSVPKMAARLEEIASKWPCIVAVNEEGHIVGYCYAHAWKEKAAYSATLETTVYLHPDFTGQGIGRLLMQRLIELCRQREFDVLIACITEGNEASIRLHRSLGFEKASHFKGVGRKFGRHLDVFDYQLTL